MEEEELIKQIGLIAKTQFDKSSALIQETLNNIDIPSEYHGVIRSIIRIHMAEAVFQKEERDHLIKQLYKKYKEEMVDDYNI